MTTKKLRTKADLLNDPRVESMWQEPFDGRGRDETWWWLQLANGYVTTNECHCLHEPTIKDLCEMMLDVVTEPQ